jgi:hypothetical protein
MRPGVVFVVGLAAGEQLPTPLEMGAGQVERGLELFVDGFRFDEVGFSGVVAAEQGGEVAEIVGVQFVDTGLGPDNLVGPGGQPLVGHLDGVAIADTSRRLGPECCTPS